MPIKYNVVAQVGEYVNRSNETKKKYKTVGAVIEKDGNFYLKMDSLVTVNDAGLPVNFFGLYTPKDKDQPQDQHNQAKSNGYQRQPVDPNGFEDSDLPF